MITVETMAEIAKTILKLAPDHHFLVLLTPQDAHQEMRVVSSLPRELQPKMAAAFVAGCEMIKEGSAFEVPFTKSH